ncbi:hypothetical protein A1O1_04809 [Capronia coronata CBS 617.96]|uniref:Uncharacterized protein n=1 Tax=Capronia coronata CBS 617.96 TaxID=1182541 RepID=W9Y517_9EURO|nr:uncharacterized protein A1O1_04809 [Capronia coronata CBS 617.96]EXJ87882.1 hypothetical protein A1O1_04809 [Capronia coronata CBS 617.96]
MSLALAPPSLMQNDIKPPHDYSIYNKSVPSRYSPPESPRNISSFFEESKMNNSHRGLPLPAGLGLPPPDRGHPSAPAPLGHLPAPPSQWAGQDDSMRSWLHAKAEEDRRKQEEEKTRQETLRLDQRRIEQSMLRESLQGGVPPPMVPLIFAGIGGGNLPGHTLEWAQQYLATLSIQNQQQQQQIQVQQQQLQLQQQQQQQSPPTQRDSRMIPPVPYGGHQVLQAPLSTQTGQPSSQDRSSISGPPPPPSTLPRLNTTEFVPSSASQSNRQALPQPQTASSEQSSGPGLFFHHWTPPNQSTGGNHPPTPSGKSNHGSPFSQSAGSHLRSEYQNSPKKRKTTGGQGVPAPPTSQHSDPSQPASFRSSREREPSPGHRVRPSRHARQDSDLSSRELDLGGRNVARPSSRQQRMDEQGGPGPGPRRQYTGSSPGGSNEDHPFRYEAYKSETR